MLERQPERNESPCRSALLLAPPPDFIFRSSQVKFGHLGSSRRPERRRCRSFTVFAVLFPFSRRAPKQGAKSCQKVPNRAISPCSFSFFITCAVKNWKTYQFCSVLFSLPSAAAPGDSPPSTMSRQSTRPLCNTDRFWTGFVPPLSLPNYLTW